MLSKWCLYWYWIVIHFGALNNEKNRKQNKKDAKDPKICFHSSVLAERKQAK